MKKLKYFLYRVLGRKPPKGTPARTIYDLKDADEDYKGRDI